MNGGILFYGDAHGDWRPLLRACEEHRPALVVLLGDCDLKRPLREEVRPIFAAGVPVRWVPGGHDAASPEMFDRLWGDHPEGNLHASWTRAAGCVVAGLGGVFKERIWYPRHGPAPATHPSRRDFMRRLPRGDRWRDGVPLRLRDAIFPEDVDALRRVQADVLVSHEAPICHPQGFMGIDAAADAVGAGLVVHGRHHESATGYTASGATVRGLGRAEAFLYRPGCSA